MRTINHRRRRIFKSLILAAFLTTSLLLSACSAKTSNTTTANIASSSGSASLSAISNVTSGDLDSQGFLDSPDGRLRVSGKSQMRLSIKNLSSPPAAPDGWLFMGPVFDVTASDRQNRPVRQLTNPLELQFKPENSGPVTVLVYADNGWEVVPSEISSEGRLVASISHLTPYTMGTPASARATPVKPSATYTTAAASSSEAQKILSSAARTLKNRDVRVTSAAGYTGSLYISLPPALMNSLGAALNASGSASYGLYNAVNEIIVANASGGQASGSLILMAEPRTGLPVSAEEARTSLTGMFPGVKASLTSVGDSGTSYTFYGVSGNTAYLPGYIDYNGLVLAYVISGSGTYQSLVSAP